VFYVKTATVSYVVNNYFDFIKNLFSKTEKEKQEPDTMKFLIAGLGNIGSDYENTRHNVGFDVIDRLAEEFSLTFKLEGNALMAEMKHKGRTFILIKPTTYMNLSGKAVRFWLKKYDISQENLLVVLDDLALPFGKQRLRPSGKDGGHNGLKNIDLTLGHNNYARLRIGIGDDFSKGRQVDYVLGKWTKKEQEVLPELLDYAAETVKAFGTIGIQFTMNQFNKK
jgi:peptidyl-tRNA hydrolase, PTH1 family